MLIRFTMPTVEMFHKWCSRISSHQMRKLANEYADMHQFVVLVGFVDKSKLHLGVQPVRVRAVFFARALPTSQNRCQSLSPRSVFKTFLHLLRLTYANFGFLFIKSTFILRPNSAFNAQLILSWRKLLPKLSRRRLRLLSPIMANHSIQK